MPPVVQSLEQILAELETAYAPMKDIYGKQQGMIPQKYDNRRQGLEGARVKNFDSIATQANRAGMGFTGFTAAEQGDYLADKYLPGLQDTYLQQENESLGLQKSLAELEQDKRLRGMTTRQAQESTAREFAEKERDRQFQAEQARLSREASARESAASRATPAVSKGELRSGAIAFLDAGKGKDKKVSPERYLQAKALWVDSGGSASEFDSSFRNYVNEAHAQDYGFAKPAAKPAANQPKYGTIKGAYY